MKEYEGFAILATNLRGNVDDAFKRRISYVVEFPFRDETQRQKLWSAMSHPQTPLAENLDLPFLARQFDMRGGNIKNAAQSAAFLAAADGGIVQMRHLVQAEAREWQKLGKLPLASEFIHYFPLLDARCPESTDDEPTKTCVLDRRRMDYKL